MAHIAGLGGIGIDCGPDHEALARWWQGLIGGEVEVDPEGYSSLVGAPGFPDLDFLPVPEEKTVKNRLHLDIRSTDYEKAIEDAIAHGATPAGDVYDGTRWQVLRDPAGNEFCILRSRPQQ